MADVFLSFWLAQRTRKLCYWTIEGRASVCCNRCPYLRQRSQMTFIKLEGFILCPDNEVFIVAFWKEDMLVIWP